MRDTKSTRGNVVEFRGNRNDNRDDLWPNEERPPYKLKITSGYYQINESEEIEGTRNCEVNWYLVLIWRNFGHSFCIRDIQVSVLYPSLCLPNHDIIRNAPVYLHSTEFRNHRNIDFVPETVYEIVPQPCNSCGIQLKWLTIQHIL